MKIKMVKGKKNKDDNNNKKRIVHNTAVWLWRLREMGFQIAAKCGYPQQQIYALWAHMCGDRVKQWTVLPLWYYTPENNTREPQQNKYLFQLVYYIASSYCLRQSLPF